jgi:TonB family protein
MMDGAMVRVVWTAAAFGVLLSGCAPLPLTPSTTPGGITGEPITLDTLDPKVREYFARVREKIKAHWTFPCVTNPATQACEYRNVRLHIEFGILKNGVVQYVEVRQGAGAGLEIYDRNAVEAIKRASPFPAMSPEVLAIVKEGSTGLPVTANFNYVFSPPR